MLAENSYLSRNCLLEAPEGCKIVVGKNRAIGPSVKMYTVGNATDQDLNHNPFGEHKRAHSGGNIVIGDGCWIGADVCIKGGSEIGTNAVIGMNSVVLIALPREAPRRSSSLNHTYLKSRERILCGSIGTI